MEPMHAVTRHFVQAKHRVAVILADPHTPQREKWAAASAEISDTSSLTKSAQSVEPMSGLNDAETVELEAGDTRNVAAAPVTATQLPRGLSWKEIRAQERQNPNQSQVIFSIRTVENEHNHVTSKALLQDHQRNDKILYSARPESTHVKVRGHNCPKSWQQDVRKLRAAAQHRARSIA